MIYKFYEVFIPPNGQVLHHTFSQEMASFEQLSSSSVLLLGQSHMQTSFVLFW